MTVIFPRSRRSSTIRANYAIGKVRRRRGSGVTLPSQALPALSAMSGLSTRYDYARPLTAAARAQHQADRQVKRFFKKIAEAEKIDRSFVSRLLRLTLLAPDIQEAILGGRQPKCLQLEELTRAMPSEWGEQRQSVNRRTIA